MPDIRSPFTRPRWLLHPAVLLLLSGPVAMPAAAQSPYLPYHGRLELDGAPVSGAVDLRFAIVSAVEDDVSCLAAIALGACGLWSEQIDDVVVTGGAFGVSLGGPGLAPSVVEGARWLAVAVDAGEGYAVLAGRQRLAGVPAAAVASASNGNFTVSGTLNVAGAFTATGVATLHDDSTIGGRRPTVSNEELRVVRGAVDLSGNPWWGSGFAVARTGPNGEPNWGTGVTYLTFNPAFTSVPAVTVSRMSAHNNDVANGGGGTDSTCAVVGIGSNVAKIHCYRLNGTGGIDEPYSFIAVGPR